MSNDLNLAALLQPRAIAILGASEDLNKLNGIPLKALIDKGYDGAIYPVNPKYQTIAGLPCYPTVDAIPGAVDLAIVTVAHTRVLDSIRALGNKGVGAAVVFSSGFAEVGEAGAARQRELAEVARTAGVRVLGPNCLGLVNAFDNVMASFAQFALGPTPGGPIALVTQSGALGTATVGVAKARGVHVGYLVTTGNEADVGVVEVMRHVLKDPRIRVGAGFIEAVRDGDGLVRLASEALEADKPLILTKLGRTEAGARAVASHTGALAGSDSIFEGIARQFGIVRARSDEQLLDFANVFARCNAPAGPRLGILTRSGGAGALMADRAYEQGLEVPDLAPSTVSALKAILPEFGSAANPVDVTAIGMFSPSVICEAFELVLNDPQIDAGIAWMGSTREVDFMVEAFAALRARAHKPFVLSWVGAPEAAVQQLSAAGVAVLRGPEPAVDALAALVRHTELRWHWLADQAAGHAAAQQVRSLRNSMAPGLSTTASPVGTLRAAALLQAAGIPIAPLGLATTPDEAVTLAEQLGYPVALKIESPDIPHKTEARGVALSLRDEAAVREAFSRITDSARAWKDDARLDGAVVQKMAGDSDTVELVVGLHMDPTFGSMVMVGLGGIFIELLKDVSFRRAPVTEAEAGRMLAELRGSAMLRGVRGRQPVDEDALCRLIAAVSRFGAAAGSRLAGLDLNPVLASPHGCVAVDQLMLLQ